VHFVQRLAHAWDTARQNNGINGVVKGAVPHRLFKTYITMTLWFLSASQLSRLSVTLTSMPQSVSSPALKGESIEMAL